MKKLNTFVPDYLTKNIQKWLTKLTMIAQRAVLASTSVLLRQSLKAKFIKLIRIHAQIAALVQMFAQLRQFTRNNSVNHKIKEAVSKAHFSLFVPKSPKGELLIFRHLNSPLQGVGGNITSF